MQSKNDLQLSMLIQALQLLAANYEEQVNALPEFVDVPDEIALIFNEVYLLVEHFNKEGLMTADQNAALVQIDSALGLMSKQEDL